MWIESFPWALVKYSLFRTRPMAKVNCFHCSMLLCIPFTKPPLFRRTFSINVVSRTLNTKLFFIYSRLSLNTWNLTAVSLRRGKQKHNFLSTFCGYVALSDPDSMKFQQWLGPFHMDWRTTMHENWFLSIFLESWYTYYSWKIV